MTQYTTQPMAPSIESYTAARAAEQKDALKTQAPRALTDLLASAMTAMAGLEASSTTFMHHAVAEKKEG